VNAELSSSRLLDCVRRHARLSFSRSGGKGGQNVNKVATKVLARVRIQDLDALDQEQRERVHAVLSGRLNDRGELAVAAEDERTQLRNRQIALERLADLIARAARKPRKRIRTRTPRKAHEGRLRGKRIRSERKRERGHPPADD
jgi:ribosome-associated protein